MFELAFISPPDIMVVMVVALLVFGPNRLPEVGRQVGQFIREGRKMMSSFTDAINDVQHEVRTPFEDQTVRGEVVKDPEPEPEKVSESESEASKLTVSEQPETKSVDEPEHELKSETKD